MITSVLLVDVHGLDSVAKGHVSPASLVSELTHTMHGLNRQITVFRAYCSPRTAAPRRAAYRDAGFEIVDTANQDETLIRLSLDLSALVAGEPTYEEAILMGGAQDYTALARLAREHLMMVSVVDHDTLSPALTVLADGLIDLAEIEVDRQVAASPLQAARERNEAARRQAPALVAPGPDSGRAASAPKVAAMTPLDRSVSERGKSAEPANSAGANDLADEPASAPRTALAPKSGSQAKQGSASAPASFAVGLTAAASAVSPVAASAPSVSADAAHAGVRPSTLKPADDAASRPVDLDLESALTASLSDDLDADLGAELEATLRADTVAGDKDPGANDTTRSPAAAPARMSPGASQASQEERASPEEDATIDALFADIAAVADVIQPDGAPSGGMSDSTASPGALADTADGAPKRATDEKQSAASTKQAAPSGPDAEVEELLSRLMSDDLTTPAPAKKAALDVVPER